MGALGFTHFLASILALVSGTIAILNPKGRRTHRSWGYIYTASMAVLLVSAFAIYDLFGSWGPFHTMAVVSSATLLCGMLPLWLRWPAKDYRGYHIAFMYWSLVGLYAALAAETGTRAFASLNMLLVMTSSLVVCIAAGIFWYYRKDYWMQRHA